MSSAVHFAPPPSPSAAGASLDGSRAALVPAAAQPRRHRRSHAPRELALTATLFSLYVGFRGGAVLLGAIEGVVQR